LTSEANVRARQLVSQHAKNDKLQTSAHNSNVN